MRNSACLALVPAPHFEGEPTRVGHIRGQSSLGPERLSRAAFRSSRHPRHQPLYPVWHVPGDATLWRNNAIIGPDYRYVVEPLWEEPGIVYAELDLDRIAEGHMLLDTDGHYSRPDVFHLEVNDKPQTSVSFESQGD